MPRFGARALPGWHACASGASARSCRRVRVQVFDGAWQVVWWPLIGQLCVPTAATSTSPTVTGESFPKVHKYSSPTSSSPHSTKNSPVHLVDARPQTTSQWPCLRRSNCRSSLLTHRKRKARDLEAHRPGAMDSATRSPVSIT